MAYKTIQSNLKRHTKDMTRYALFLGGTNVTSKSLEQYDPLKTGFARIFFLKMPVFMKEVMPDETKKIKHLMEYGFTGIDGIQNITMDFESINGGYSGKSFETATGSKDDTNSITIKLYEFSGSPVREYITTWISGISDPFTGLKHYHGAIGKNNIEAAQVNEVAEAIYVQTDATGRSDSIEYACLLTNMIPKQAKTDQFNYESGSHPIVQTDIEFTTTKYESAAINELAKALVKKYQILGNYLDFDPGYTVAEDIDSLPEQTVEGWSKTGEE